MGPRLFDYDGSGAGQALPREPELGRHQQYLFLDRSEPRHCGGDLAAIPAVRGRQSAGSLRCVRARRLSAGERRALEHDPEKWIPVFGKRSCSTNKLERDGDSKIKSSRSSVRLYPIATSLNRRKVSM